MKNEYFEKAQEYRKQNLAEWETILKNIFPDEVPETYIWTKFTDIIDTINLIGEGGHTVHMFSPSGGGLDIGGALPASEWTCIKLITEGSYDIVKPGRLIFQSFQNQGIEWAYFRLETEELEPVSDYFYEGINEQLTLLPNGKYDHPSVYENFDRDEQPELIGCTRVMRFTKSSFVMFAKASFYNRISETYDARHNKMNANEFRDYIEKMIELIAQLESEYQNKIKNSK